MVHVMEIKCARPGALIQLTKVTPGREKNQLFKIDNYRIVCMKECGIHSHDKLSLIIRRG